jgi:S1-C subfamily serine protease
MVSRQAATGFSGSGDLKAEALREANQYCVSQKKTMQVVSTSEAKPPYIYGNFPKAEVQFMCLDPNDPELARPKLKKDADTVIGRTVPSGNTGTGFAITSNGFIVTAYHVVENATNIQVRFPSGRWVLAKPLKLSRTTDIAILKTDVTTSAHLYLADMTRVKQGQRVFTLGYPVPGVLGEQVKYTEGVISSLSGLQGEDSLMQITVPVQPGNSGGPLVNEAGEVVGIITSSAAITAFFRITGTLPQNVNWAVKGNYILSLLNDKPKVENRDQPPDIVEMVKSAVVLIKTE